MTFWILAAGVSLSVYFLVWLCALAAVHWLQRILSRRLLSASPAVAANILFAIRSAPLLLALVASVGLALPAFLRFEPRITSEAFGLRLWVLSTLGMVVVGANIFRAVRIGWNTRWRERAWREISTEIGRASGATIPVFAVDEPSSLLAVTGVLHPKIFVSREIIRVLSPGELAAAIDHEAAHVGFFDNLKQWVLRIAQPPRWLDSSALSTAAWTAASETAADEAALRQGASALDLAAALVKVARLKSAPDMNARIAVSHLLPELPGTCLEARIARLRASLDMVPGDEAESRRPGPRKLVLWAIPITAYATCLCLLLPWIHEALEFLVS